MGQIEVFVRLKLPDAVADSQHWEALFKCRLERYRLLTEPSFFMDEEQEIMSLRFRFEGPLKLNEMLSAVAETGALVIDQLFRFPLQHGELSFVTYDGEPPKTHIQPEDINKVISSMRTTEGLKVLYGFSAFEELLRSVKEIISNYKADK